MPFPRAKKTEAPLIMDGAMGTMLFSLGYPKLLATDYANQICPNLVNEIHSRYIRAGSKALLTNTFNTFSEKSALEGEVVRLDRFAKGLNLAGKGRANKAKVFISFGPWAPIGNNDFLKRLLAKCQRVRGIIFETCYSLEAFDWIRKLQDLWKYKRVYWGVSFSFWKQEGSPVLPDGTKPEKVAEISEKAGIGVLGVNCGRNISLSSVAQIVKSYRVNFPGKVLAKPNAGSPGKGKGSGPKALSPIVFAKGMRKIVAAGANWVGGCCGTTNHHIQYLSRAFSNQNIK